jgi:hypothetical protein
MTSRWEWGGLRSWLNFDRGVRGKGRPGVSVGDEHRGRERIPSRMLVATPSRHLPRGACPIRQPGVESGVITTEGGWRRVTQLSRASPSRRQGDRNPSRSSAASLIVVASIPV